MDLMYADKIKAIVDTIAHWTWIANTGEDKENYPLLKMYDELKNGCFLCEYVQTVTDGRHERAACHRYCPYAHYFGFICHDDYEGSNFKYWQKSDSKEMEQHFAKLFVKDLEAVLRNTLKYDGLTKKRKLGYENVWVDITHEVDLSTGSQVNKLQVCLYHEGSFIGQLRCDKSDCFRHPSYGNVTVEIDQDNPSFYYVLKEYEVLVEE